MAAVNSSQSTRTIVIKQGPVRAAVRDGLVYAHGIPFAKVKRFQPPQPPVTWTEERDATQKAAKCPQLPFRFEFVLGPLADDRPVSEDCLTVTVIAPESATPTSNLPVVVWIHGGANIAGCADMKIMDTSGLASRGIVSVVIQYRLGIFGCLPIDGIAPPNLQLQDQIAALRWTQNNVSAFGGNPDEVTIMGQSAGGSAVYTLMLSEGTDDLYQRAFIMSNPFAILATTNKEHALVSKQVSQSLGGTPEAAAALSPDALLEIQDKLQETRGGNVACFFPAWGSFPLCKAADIDTRLVALAKQKKQLLISWANEDALPFIGMNPWGARIKSLPLFGSWFNFGIGKLATNLIFARGALALNELWRKSGGNSSTFRVDWFPTGSWLRACHCIEMPFVFGVWETWAKTPLLNGRESEKFVAETAPVVKDMIADFIKGSFAPHQTVVLDSQYTRLSYKRVGA